MPYYITDKSPDCLAWAVVKADGEVIACHESKEDAIAQAVAISLAEDEPFEGERNLDGPKVKIADIDGTLIAGGRRVDRVYDYLQTVDGELFLVTGRPDSERSATVRELADLGIRYSELRMNPGSTADSVAFKKAEAESLLETYNVVFAVENNLDAVRAYKSLGIAAVTPNEIDSTSTRAAVGELSVGDYVSWNVLDPEILAEIIAVDGQYAILRLYDEDDGVFEPTDKLMVLNILKLQIVPRPEFVVEDESYENVIEPVDPLDSPDEVYVSVRSIDEPAPAYMRAAARRGLEYYEQGLGGDGLVDRTIREAREMAAGRVSDDKWIRIAAWIARHMPDLDAPDADPNSPDYPSPGVVAHLLWGSGPSKRAAERALAFAEGVVARIRAEEDGAMTESNELRDKWLNVAWAIKSRLEGGEARAVNGVETRTGHVTLEVREGGDGMTFEGYAAVFNSPSEPLPFTEVIAPGAFKRSLQGRHRMMLLWNHDTSQPLASTRNGSLKLVEDNVGLRVSATLPNTTLGRDIAEQIRSGLTDAMSFGFQVKKDSWSADGSTRTLHEVALHEVSLVSFPAYEGTADKVSIREVRSIDADVLADGLLRLESGEELSAEQAATIKEVVDKLAATPEVAEVEGDILALKKKKLDLLLKGI